MCVYVGGNKLWYTVCGGRGRVGKIYSTTVNGTTFHLGAAVFVFFTLEDGTHHTGNPGGFSLISRQSGGRRSAC